MAFAITKVQCYGIEAEEPLNKRYRQYMVLNITGLATDTDLDLGDNQTGSLGTFWDAVDGTDIGAKSLYAIQDIVTRAESFDSFGGNFLDRAQADSSGGAITVTNSGASTGGSASETLTLTGAATGDTVISAYVSTGASGTVALKSAASSIATASQFPVVFTGDPGAGAIVRVALQRAAGSTGAVAPGTYTVSYANKTPNITFGTSDAPTTYEIVLKWVLQPQTYPVEYSQTA
jgi:hypothetical protein